MAAVGDRVQVPSKRVGQAPRDGVVTGVSGGLLRVTWSTGEESTITPSMGSLVVVGRVKIGAGKSPAVGPPSKKASKRASKKTASKKTAKKAASAPAKKVTPPSPKSKRARAAKSPSKKAGRVNKRHR